MVDWDKKHTTDFLIVLFILTGSTENQCKQIVIFKSCR